MSAASIRALEEHRCREAFERNCERLHFELAMGTPRRHLDVLLELLRLLVSRCGNSQQTAAAVDRLTRLERIVASRHNLRIAGGHHD